MPMSMSMPVAVAVTVSMSLVEKPFGFGLSLDSVGEEGKVGEASQGPDQNFVHFKFIVINVRTCVAYKSLFFRNLTVNIKFKYISKKQLINN